MASQQRRASGKSAKANSSTGGTASGRPGSSPRKKPSAAAGTASSRRPKTGGKNRRNPDKLKKAGQRERAVTAFLDDTVQAESPGMPALPWVWLRWTLGLLLVPLLWVTVEAFFMSFTHVAKHFAFWKTDVFWFFGIGAVMGVITFFGLKGRVLTWLYVAGHELTHAMFVLICGGNVRKIRISSEGGYILTNKNNLLISLSPYFVPFYTILSIALWWLAEWAFFDFAPAHFHFLFAVIGVTWSLHICFTFWMIAREQPDLEQNGVFFSLMLIGLMNMLLISSMLVVAAPAVSWQDYVLIWAHNLATLGERFTQSVRELLGMVMG